MYKGNEHLFDKNVNMLEAIPITKIMY